MHSAQYILLNFSVMEVQFTEEDRRVTRYDGSERYKNEPRPKPGSRSDHKRARCVREVMSLGKSGKLRTRSVV